MGDAVSADGGHARRSFDGRDPDLPGIVFVELKPYQSGMTAVPTIATRLWPPPFWLFAPRRYRDQPITALRASYRRAFLRSLPRWQLPMVAFAVLFWPLAILASSLRQLLRHGRRVKATAGRSYGAQFRDHFAIGLSANLWPSHYYMFELFRDELRPRAYEYFRRTETKRALYKLLRTDYREEDRFRNKLRFFRACSRAGVRAAPVIFAVAEGEILHPESGARPIFPPSDLFIKPIAGRGGTGAEIIRFRDAQYHLADGQAVTGDGLITVLRGRSSGEGLLVQPRLINHPALADINMQALSTVRVVTATETDGSGRVIAAALRVPSKAGSAVDNFHAGGIAAAVDIETGRLGKATDLGIKADSRWHSVHPVTGAPIEGLVVPDWPQLVELAETAHARVADRIVLGWDIGVLADGPCIVEANAYPDLDICQRTMLAPLGNGRLAWLMAYHLERLGHH
jgi:hypothetical protein